MKYIIKKKAEITLELEVSCRRCEKIMTNIAALTENHLYFGCDDCGTVIVIDWDIKN